MIATLPTSQNWKKEQKLHKRCHTRVFALSSHTTTPYSSKRAPLLYMCVTTLAGEGGGGWKIIVCSVHNKVIRKVTMSFTGYLTPNQFFHPEFHRVSHTQLFFSPWVSCSGFVKVTLTDCRWFWKKEGLTRWRRLWLGWNSWTISSFWILRVGEVIWVAFFFLEGLVQRKGGGAF